MPVPNPGPAYASDRGSLAADARAEEIEALERRVSVVARLADDLEAQAGIVRDQRLTAALTVLKTCAERVCVELLREARS